MIRYVKGDATNPILAPGENGIIVHCCNDVGAWGAGFVLAISKRWPEPEELYKHWFRSREKPQLGMVQFVRVSDDLMVANIIGQHSTGWDVKMRPPIRYEAIRQGLSSVACIAKNDSSVHMPRMGCGFAGGEWSEIERIVNEELVAKGINVTVYDWDGEG